MLTGFGPMLDHVVPFALVFARIAGLLIFAPVLGSVTIPVRAKVLFAIAFSVAIYPVLPLARHAAPPMDLFGLVPLMLFETLIGIAIGMMASIPLIAVQMGGNIMGYQMGLTLAQTFNPELDGNSDVVGQLAFFLATAVFIGMDGLEGMYIALISTFEHLPAGGFRVDATGLSLLTGMIASAFEIALRVAAPVIAITTIMLVAMGVIMKTMPQVNVLTIGFALKIVAGVAMLIVALVVIAEVSDEHSGASIRDIMQWAGELRPAGA